MLPHAAGARDWLRTRAGPGAGRLPDRQLLDGAWADTWDDVGSGGGMPGPPGGGANGGCAPNSRKWRLLGGGAREAALRADTWDVLWAGGSAGGGEGERMG